MEIDTNGTDHGDHDDRGAPGAAVLTPRSLSSSSSNGSAMAASAAAARNSLVNSAATPSSSQQQQHATTQSSISSSVGSSASTFQRFLTRGIGSGGGEGGDTSTRINPDSIVQLTLSDDRDHTVNIMRISTKNPFEDDNDDDDDNDDNASNDNNNNDTLLVGENGVAAATAADDDDDDDDHTETMNNSAARPSLPSTTASARAAATSGRSIGTNSTLGFAHSVSSSTGNGNGNGGVNGSHHHHQGDAFYGTRQDDYANGWTLSGKMDMLGGRVDLRDDRGNLLAVVTKVATGGYTILEPTPSYEGQPPYRRKISRRFLYPVMTVHRNYFFSGGGFRRGRYRLAMADPSAKSYIAEDCGRGMLFGNSSRVLRIVPAGAKSSSLSGQQPPCALIRHSFYKGKVDKPQWDVVLMGLDNPRTMCPPRAILCFVAIINRSMGRS